ncbi:MAG: hypothetical protein A2W85_09845 [Bacteroidetes bacterium GWF2_41_31]|nr:MAG: hypothetical protein A2W85_09845 [Bacteroidetes bacterium GWF2_41_31]
MLFDSGVADFYRHHIFKYRIMEFARQTGLLLFYVIILNNVAKCNTIEHQLFIYVRKAIESFVF